MMGALLASDTLALFQKHQVHAAAGSGTQSLAQALSAQASGPPWDPRRQGPACEIPALLNARPCRDRQAGPAPGSWPANQVACHSLDWGWTGWGLAGHEGREGAVAAAAATYPCFSLHILCQSLQLDYHLYDCSVSFFINCQHPKSRGHICLVHLSVSGALSVLMTSKNEGWNGYTVVG